VDKLPPSILRRIRSRYAWRFRRYQQGHSGFSRVAEMYYFFGASAVLSCFRDPAARELDAEWLRDWMAGRSPADKSAGAQAARASYRNRFDELDALLEKLQSEAAAETANHPAK